MNFIEDKRHEISIHTLITSISPHIISYEHDHDVAIVILLHILYKLDII